MFRRILLALVIPCVFCFAPGAGQSPSKRAPQNKDYHGDPLPAGALARFGTFRMRMAGRIADVAFLPGNQHIAVASSMITNTNRLRNTAKGVIRLWNLESGKTFRDFEGVEQSFKQIAFSADGKTMAGLLDGSSLAFWDSASGKKLPEKIRLIEHLDHFVLSPDGKTVAIAAHVAHPGRILIWYRGSKERETFAILPLLVDSLAFSADSKRLTSVTLADQHYWGHVVLWDVAKGSKIREFKHGGSQVTLSSDGSLAAWADTEGKNTIVTDVYDKRKPVTIAGNHQSLLFSLDNKTLVTTAQSGIVVFWDLASGRELRRLEGTVGRVLRFSPDGKLLATATTDWAGQTLVRVWDAASGKEIHPVPAHDDHIICAAVSPDGSIIASGSADRTIRLWQARTGKPLHLLAGHEGDISALVFAPDGKTLASAAQDKSVRLWDTGSGKEKANHAGLAASVLSLAFTPDGKTLRGVAGDGSIHSWQGGRSKVVNLMDKNHPLGLALAPDAGTMVTSDQSRGSLRFRQLPVGKPLEQIPLFDNTNERFSQCWSAAFSADGRYLATSETHPTHGQILRLWEVAGGQEILEISLPTGSKNLAFSLDGRLLASTHGENVGPERANGEGRTLVWDTFSGRKVADFQGQTGPVTCAAFAPDGKTIVAGNGDHTLLAWDLGKATVRLDLPRNMLKDAWEELAGNDAPVAYRTVLRLIAAGADSVPFLGEQLRPSPPLKAIEPLIADLNSDKFSVRQAATRKLEDIGEAAESALRQALLRNGSLEHRRRIEILLGKLNQPPNGRQLRILRALTVLERTGSKAARELLQTLAAGVPEARQTREARAALERIKTRRN